MLEYFNNSKLKVIVKPNSKKTEILGFDKEKKALRIALKEPAVDNKANTALIKFISKEIKERVVIKTGLNSKNKLIEIRS